MKVDVTLQIPAAGGACRVFEAGMPKQLPGADYRAMLSTLHHVDVSVLLPTCLSYIPLLAAGACTALKSQHTSCFEVVFM
jgi:hypothetical protein